MSEPSTPPRSRVLVVDDELAIRTTFARLLKHAGYDTLTADSASAALEHIEQNVPDVVISDLTMPGESGIDLLRAIRGRDLDVPVIFLTGNPSIQSAARAVELGAFRYLMKPVENEELKTAVADAVRTRAFAHARGTFGGRQELEQTFKRALDSLWMAFQPLVHARTKQAIGYEALMRSREPEMRSPLDVIDAAEKLGTLHMLGQTVRARVAEVIATTPAGPTFYVNVHVADLVDPELFDPKAPLSQHANRIVLELTERASLEGVSELHDRTAQLRAMGYRFAVDDLGAGYAGLSYFASVKPEVVKIDMSLVRDVHRDPIKRSVVASLASLAKSLGIEVVAEGIETTEERNTLVELGIDYLQGYALARPGPAFPPVVWSE